MFSKRADYGLTDTDFMASEAVDIKLTPAEECLQNDKTTVKKVPVAAIELRIVFPVLNYIC